MSRPLDRSTKPQDETWTETGAIVEAPSTVAVERPLAGAPAALGPAMLRRKIARRAASAHGQTRPTAGVQRAAMPAADLDKTSKVSMLDGNESPQGYGIALPPDLPPALKEKPTLRKVFDEALKRQLAVALPD